MSASETITAAGLVHCRQAMLAKTRIQEPFKSAELWILARSNEFPIYRDFALHALMGKAARLRARGKPRLWYKIQDFLMKEIALDQISPGIWLHFTAETPHVVCHQIGCETIQDMIKARPELARYFGKLATSKPTPAPIEVKAPESQPVKTPTKKAAEPRTPKKLNGEKVPVSPTKPKRQVLTSFAELEGASGLPH